MEVDPTLTKELELPTIHWYIGTTIYLPTKQIHTFQIPRIPVKDISLT